jgi:trehalose-phosphatase
LEHLLTVCPRVLENVRRAKHILLFSDYDGTLTPIVESPELAHISESTRELLRALVDQHRITLGIISGRALADLRNMVAVNGAVYAGNHGFEIEGPGLSFVNPLAEEIQPFLRAISQILTLTLKTTRGVFIENKGLTLSVHFRQMANENIRSLKIIFQRLIKEAQVSGKFRITPGKKVFELRPAVDWNKGDAIKLLAEKYGQFNGKTNETLPIYLGDDLTDEDGFAAIGKYGNGIAVYVGREVRNTAANYFLRSPEEVAQFLKILLEGLKEDVYRWK